MLISIIIRTYNEEGHLHDALQSILSQDIKEHDIEVIIVDSGSSDRTLKIAHEAGCLITHIKKTDFTFGRALNLGCGYSNGEILVFISGHCVPIDNNWLKDLIEPIVSEKAAYAYGRQIGDESTRFSEHQIFKKYYKRFNQISHDDYFCNNANAAISRRIWEAYLFDEGLTGLEDMEMAKRLIEAGEAIAYCSGSIVYHLHDESWSQVKNRYERESYALQKIMPEIHVNLLDAIRYYWSSIMHDIRTAKRNKVLSIMCLREILMFRLMQYWGTYRGNHEHRKLSAKRKEKYFYPV